jgi:hypothetical protein
MVSGREAAAPGGEEKWAVQGPEAGVPEEGGGEKVDVGPAEAGAGQTVGFDALKGFGGRREWCLGKLLEKLEEVGAIAEVAADELADDTGMTEHLVGGEGLGESGREPIPEMCNPDRGVSQDHLALSERRRRGALSCGWEPARAARRRAASRAISAWRPA